MLYYGYYTFNHKIYTPEKTFVTLTYGSSSDKIIEKFNKYGFFEPKWFFKYFLRLEYKKRKTFIEAGTYQLPEQSSNSELINKLFTKELLYQNKLTIPEGSNIFEVARAFKKHLKFDSTQIVKLLTDREFAGELGVNANTLEGFIMPETYFFQENQSPKNVIKFLVKNQQELLKTIANQKKTKLTEYQILILASIIQGETSNIDEMPIISSVYHNRLRLNMPLQADPTILYPIYPQKIIYKSDLKRDDPYNTYLRKGLTPTPINSPSKQAIYAAANPAQTSYLYFVAKNDSTKTHSFSTNLNQHIQNIRKNSK